MNDLFKNKRFLRYFFADNIAKIADNYFFIFLAWLALNMTGSAAQVGGLLMANAIPRLVFMILGGNLADRFAPHIILRLGNIIQGLGLVLVLIGLINGGLPIAGLYILAIVFGTVDAFSLPASMSAIPRIVPKEQLISANSLVQSAEMISFGVGVLVAGAVMQFNNMQIAAIINIVLYAIAALLFFTVKLNFYIAENADDLHDSEFKRIKSGLVYTFKNQVLRANLLLLLATNLAASGPISIGLLVLVTVKLDQGPFMFTVVFATYAIGVILGSIAMGTRKHINGPGRIIIADYLVTGVTFVMFGLLNSIWLLIAICLLVGILGGVASTIGSTWAQLHTKPSMLGRVSALSMIAALAFDPFSQGLTGLLIEWSLTGMFCIAGVFIIVATLIVISFNPIFLKREKLDLGQSQNITEEKAV